MPSGRNQERGYRLLKVEVDAGHDVEHIMTYARAWDHG